MSEHEDRTLSVAATIAAWIAASGSRSAVIGAVALAVHGHVRATRDLDLATALDPATQLRALDERAQREGGTIQLEMPDSDDPLGRVLTVTGDGFDPVQVVNFYNPSAAGRNPGSDALLNATELRGVPRLAVVRLEDLVLLKLYAGGGKSRMDVHELLAVHPETGASCERGQRRSVSRPSSIERSSSRDVRPAS